MHISASGWKRDHGPMILASADIRVEPSDRIDVYRPNQVYVSKWENGMVTVSQKMEAKLNGNYLLEINLTRDEIGYLMRIAFNDRSLEEVLKTLTKPRAK